MVRGDCLLSPAVPGAVLGPFHPFLLILTIVLGRAFSPPFDTWGERGSEVCPGLPRATRL